jgi:hypothetical protein
MGFLIARSRAAGVSRARSFAAFSFPRSAVFSFRDMPVLFRMDCFIAGFRLTSLYDFTALCPSLYFSCHRPVLSMFLSYPTLDYRKIAIPCSKL